MCDITVNMGFGELNEDQLQLAEWPDVMVRR